MSQEQYQMNAYPRDSVPPEKKDKYWGMGHAKATYYDYCNFPSGTCFYQSAQKYEENMLYALGMQPVTKYRKLFGVDDQTNDTWLNLDWSISHVAGTIIDIAISRMCQQEYGIVATPIDEDTKTELDKYISAVKAKILVRDMAAQASPELATHPALHPEANEPEDMEELEMRVQYGESFVRSKDAEEAIQLAFYRNEEKMFRRRLFQDLFYFGITGYDEWLEDGMPKFRNVNRECVITNYCRWADFRDLHHAGEVIDVDLVDLALVKNDDGTLMFTDEQLEQMATDLAGKFGNPLVVGQSSSFFKGYDRFKCKVFKVRWLSYNNYVYSDRKNSKGNPVFGEAPSHKINSTSEKYVTKRIQVAYEVKWIVGTDYAYDFKLMKDMPRSKDPKKKAMTSLGYRFIAPNFYEMRAKSMMDRLIPIIDQYQMNVYRCQNIKTRMVANGWWVDLDALENVSLSAGGEKMKPMDLLQMFFDTGVLVGRSKDIMGDNVNYKPVMPIQNSIFNDLVAVGQDMMQQVQQMKSIVGLNDVTDSSTPNPKMLNGVANMMDQGTNNSLYPMQFAERWLMEKLAGDVYLRMQQAVQRGDVSGYIPALNSNTLKYIKLTTESLVDCGIMLEEKPTDDQKQFLVSNMQQNIAAGTLDLSDAVMIVNTNNLKAAEMKLAYKVKKNKAQMQKDAMANQQQTIQGQQQSAAQTAQAAIQLEQLQQKGKMDIENMRSQTQIKVEGMKLQSAEGIALQNNQAKVAGHVVNNMPEGAFAQQPEPSVGQESNIPEDAMQ